jgi:hypothetical protein
MGSANSILPSQSSKHEEALHQSLREMSVKQTFASCRRGTLKCRATGRSKPPCQIAEEKSANADYTPECLEGMEKKNAGDEHAIRAILSLRYNVPNVYALAHN